MREGAADCKRQLDASMNLAVTAESNQSFTTTMAPHFRRLRPALC